MVGRGDCFVLFLASACDQRLGHSKLLGRTYPPFIPDLFPTAVLYENRSRKLAAWTGGNALVIAAGLLLRRDRFRRNLESVQVAFTGNASHRRRSGRKFDTSPWIGTSNQVCSLILEFPAGGRLDGSPVHSHTDLASLHHARPTRSAQRRHRSHFQARRQSVSRPVCNPAGQTSSA